ncbi:hypothetical protein VSS74_29695 [Conexibacter stalactiti]|uniref:ASCH domain-containing protein n=1 Tax=Conexibacter stalactiti TaxID=1940611 RepID=A0ABU4HZ71_9ACTN|nr:hypothetical protein [Conexibacter stalactiti]MDW5598571.1 hypothetical protein [Conexibacter stalactiti]MEC5039213.1 hypothetical protein [Conexibacter stalactiti]
MLFPARLHAGLADGSVTVAFRRWRRPSVKAGRTLRTAVGVLAIDAVERVPLAAIGEDDARAAGYDSRAELLASLRPPAPGVDPEMVHRIAFHHAGADPRIALREQAELTPAELGRLCARLDAIDARSRRGPWTGAVLRLIAEHPGLRAAELAALAGRETLPFKADVRRLKELGLTESLEVGYRLSPRGHALLHKES